MPIETPLVQPLLNAWRWILAGGCWIQDRETHELVRLVPNHVQTRVFAAMLRQARAGKPIRIVVPKYRRGGVSTIVQAIIWYLCATLERRRAGTFAHSTDATEEIFEITKIIHDHSGQVGRQGAAFIRFGDTRSLYACKTAGARGVRRGSGLTYAHICELSYLQSVAGLDASAIAALFATVADSPHTICVLESTGAGPTGEFHRISMQASRGEGSYELAFLAWWEDARNVRPSSEDWSATADELALAKQFGLSDAQLCWRRAKLADYPDAPSFSREYPSNLAECFNVQAGLVYGAFNAVPVEQHGHIGTLAIGKDWKRYRAMDYGSNEQHPFVCLYIAHNPKHPPRLVIAPACHGVGGKVGLIEEFGLYKRHPKTGDTIHLWNDGLDALRYAVTAFHLHGLVYVYAALYVYNGNVVGLTGCIREVYRMEGIDIPLGAGSNFGSYAARVKTRYSGNVIDRSRPESFRDLERWGIRPLRGQPADVPRLSLTKDKSTQRPGEVEGGIERVQSLLTGDALFFSPKEPAIKTIQRKLLIKAADGRDTDPRLSKKEIRALKDLKARQTRSRAVEVN